MIPKQLLTQLIIFNIITRDFHLNKLTFPELKCILLGMKTTFEKTPCFIK